MAILYVSMSISYQYINGIHCDLGGSHGDWSARGGCDSELASPRGVDADIGRVRDNGKPEQSR